MSTLDGTWNVIVQSPIGEQKSTLTLKSDAGRLTGTMAGAGEQSDIKDARAVGGRVTWSTDITSPIPLRLEFSGMVENDAMSGEVTLGMLGKAPFTGVRG